MCIPNILRCLFDPGKGVLGNSLRRPGIFYKSKNLRNRWDGLHVIYIRLFELTAYVRHRPNPSRYEIGLHEHLPKNSLTYSLHGILNNISSEINVHV